MAPRQLILDTARWDTHKTIRQVSGPVVELNRRFDPSFQLCGPSERREAAPRGNMRRGECWESCVCGSLHAVKAYQGERELGFRHKPPLRGRFGAN